ncbi:MAG: ABC transporter substrate-binding protein [Novosphingobium sp. 17-62-8]|nr:MAG: ABC transporter substrate-binding protein [Novosphingobium sp. 17-62-8]
MRRLGVIYVLLGALQTLVVSGCARPVEKGVTELVYASPYSPNHPFSKADQEWMAFVEKRSEGRLKVRPVWSGALLSSDMSMEELRHGVADIGLITPIYVRGGTHLIRIQAGFYQGADSVESQVALYRCIAAENPAVQGGTLPGLITVNRPVKSLADIKGLRIRAPTELLSVLDSLGADPVNMPMGEVYSAMAKGVIDGVIAPEDTFKSQHFGEISKHFYQITVPRGAYPARAMSAKRWNTLAAEDRAVLEEGIGVWEAALARQVRAAVNKGVQEAATYKVTFTPATAADQQRFNAIYLRDSEANARGLKAFGIDGEAAFRSAREAVQGRDRISCGSGT